MILSRNDKFLGAILYKKRDFLDPRFVQETENVGESELREEDRQDYFRSSFRISQCPFFECPNQTTLFALNQRLRVDDDTPNIRERSAFVTLGFFWSASINL